MQAVIRSMLLLNIYIIYLGGVYLLWFWKYGHSNYECKRYQRQRYFFYFYSVFIGVWPFGVEVFLACIAFLSWKYSPLANISILYKYFSVYSLVFSVIYYISAWIMLIKFYRKYQSNVPKCIKNLGRILLECSGFGIINIFVWVGYLFNLGYIYKDVLYDTIFMLIGFSVIAYLNFKVFNYIER